MGEGFQGQGLVFVEKVFVNDDRFGVRQVISGESSPGYLVLFVVAHHGYQKLGQE